MLYDDIYVVTVYTIDQAMHYEESNEGLCDQAYQTSPEYSLNVKQRLVFLCSLGDDVMMNNTEWTN